MLVGPNQPLSLGHLDGYFSAPRFRLVFFFFSPIFLRLGQAILFPGQGVNLIFGFPNIKRSRFITIIMPCSILIFSNALAWLPKEQQFQNSEFYLVLLQNHAIQEFIHREENIAEFWKKHFLLQLESWSISVPSH